MAVCPVPDEVVAVSNSHRMAEADEAMLIADVDNHALVRVSTVDHAVWSGELGGTPSRVVVAGSLAYVTLSDTDEVVAVRPDTLEVVSRFPVGNEPTGIVASESTGTLFVALTLEDRVVELSHEGLELRSFHVPGQPQWLALQDDAGVLAVGARLSPTVTTLRLTDGWRHQQDMPGATPTQTPRITGDLAWTAGGDLLAVPVLYVDHTTPAANDEAVIGGLTIANPAYYAEARFGAVLELFELGDGLTSVDVVTAAADVDLPNGEFGWVGRDAAIELRHSLRDDGSASLDRDAARYTVLDRVASYVSSVSADAMGRLVYTMEGSHTAGVLCAESTGRGRPALHVYGGDGVHAGVGAEDGSVYLATGIDRSVRQLDPRVVAEGLRARRTQAMVAHRALAVARLPESQLAPELQMGRSLFLDAVDPRMSMEAAAISCGTCHFEGRNDGLAWEFPDGPRQTPALGGLLDTAPYTWASDVPSVEEEVRRTSQGRMLGQGVGPRLAESIASYVDSMGHETASHEDPDAVARGREVFQRADVGCVTCHPAPLYTDGKAHVLYAREPINTPSLRGVGSTPPYLHNGYLDDLRAVLESASKVGMGETAHLSEGERDDLEAFLRTL
jgi:cytochrome c553